MWLRLSATDFCALQTTNWQSICASSDSQRVQHAQAKQSSLTQLACPGSLALGFGLTATAKRCSLRCAPGSDHVGTQPVKGVHGQACKHVFAHHHLRAPRPQHCCSLCGQQAGRAAIKPSLDPHLHSRCQNMTCQEDIRRWELVTPLWQVVDLMVTQNGPEVHCLG